MSLDALPPIRVFGSSGQLGRALAQELSNSRFKFELLDRSSFSVRDNVADLRMRIHPGSLVINCVAMTDVDGCQSDEVSNQMINHHFASKLAMACHEKDSHLIQISTDFVFGSGNFQWDVSDAPRPTNSYGLAKLQGERDVLATGGSIVRTSMLFSEVGGFPRKLLRNADTTEQIVLPNNLFGTPTSARSLAEWLIAQAASGPELRSISHFCSTDFLSRAEFGRRILKFTGKTNTVIESTLGLTHGQAARPTNSAMRINIENQSFAKTSDEMLRDYDWVS